ncbi:thaumatin-like protein [Lactarius hatsudake]|nr:thaumatin-like protein [Lactarius hatsudake]
MRLYIVLLFAMIVLCSLRKMGRTFTINNTCSSTICCSPPLQFTTNKLFTDPSAVTATPSQGTGWAAPPFSSISFFVPDNWSSGRIWVSASAPVAVYWLSTASYGGYKGGLLCDAQTGDTNILRGVPPATVAEFTLSTDRTGSVPDYFSLVDGYNLPSSLPLDSNNSPNCCTGSYNTAATCPSSGVPYFSYFKSNRPNTYVYAYDESSGTALFSCPSSNQADYTVAFCP